MKYDKFLHDVRERADLDDPDEAERTSLVVLQALADRLTGEEARELLAQLPGPLKEAVIVAEEPVKMKVSEFVERVAEELGVMPEEARRRAEAVFGVLREAVSPGELHDVLVQLPSGYAELLV